MNLAQQPPAPPNAYVPSHAQVRLPAPLDALPLPGVELATPGVRLLARIIDNLILVCSLSPMFLEDVVVTDNDSAWGLAVVCVLVFMGIAFAQIMLITATGASFGKRLLRIKMVCHDGGDVGFLHGWLIRSCLYGLLEGVGNAMVFGIPALVDSLMIFTRHGQTLHDRMAGTYVIKAR
jgi:uncharacterized RDD family membrane protein YckC